MAFKAISKKTLVKPPSLVKKKRKTNCSFRTLFILPKCDTNGIKKRQHFKCIYITVGTESSIPSKVYRSSMTRITSRSPMCEIICYLDAAIHKLGNAIYLLATRFEEDWWEKLQKFMDDGVESIFGIFHNFFVKLKLINRFIYYWRPTRWKWGADLMMAHCCFVYSRARKFYFCRSIIWYTDESRYSRTRP